MNLFWNVNCVLKGLGHGCMPGISEAGLIFLPVLFGFRLYKVHILMVLGHGCTLGVLFDTDSNPFLKYLCCTGPKFIGIGLIFYRKLRILSKKTFVLDCCKSIIT